MCGDSQPSADAFRRNLAVDMFLPRKIYLVGLNSLRKILRLKTCCGHAGEPGC